MYPFVVESWNAYKPANVIREHGFMTMTEATDHLAYVKDLDKTLTVVDWQDMRYAVIDVRTGATVAH